MFRLLCKLNSFCLYHILKSGVKFLFHVRLSLSISSVSIGGCFCKKYIVFPGYKVLRNFRRVGAGKHDIDVQTAVAKVNLGVTFATSDFVEQVGIRGVILELITVILLNVDEIKRFRA